MKQIWHPYTLWEETSHGLWRAPTKEEEQSLFNATFKVMQRTEIWGYYMSAVTSEWFYSCEHNLTHDDKNRLAWLGQASMALAIGAPESLTRKAWGMLSSEQRGAANSAATLAIQNWECRSL